MGAQGRRVRSDPEVLYCFSCSFLRYCSTVFKFCPRRELLGPGNFTSLQGLDGSPKRGKTSERRPANGMLPSPIPVNGLPPFRLQLSGVGTHKRHINAATRPPLSPSDESPGLESSPKPRQPASRATPGIRCPSSPAQHAAVVLSILQLHVE